MELNRCSPIRSHQECNDTLEVLIKKEQISSTDQKLFPLNVAQSMSVNKSNFHEDTLIKISSDMFNFSIIENSLKVQPLHGSEIKSENQIINTNLSVMCLRSYNELKRTCEKMGLKFVECSNINTSKRCSVKCLSSLTDMGEKCKKLNLKCDVDMSHKVNSILADRNVNGKKNYLIQWKNDYCNTTWECENHIRCQKLIASYKSLKGSSSQLTKAMFVHFIHDLVKRKPYDFATLIKLCNLFENKSTERLTEDFEIVNISITKLRKRVKKFLDISPIELNKLRRNIWKIMQFGLKRKSVLITLKQYERKINSDGTVQVTVENNVDLEGPPDFKFINDYIINENIEIVKEPVSYCSCENCHQSKEDCCPHSLDGQWAYDRYGKVKLDPGSAIYECNSKCKCGIDCYNRVVQHGQKIKVGIFKTSNGRGWGLQTLEPIAKGQFVLEYLGEILTTGEAEKRDRSSGDNNGTYLFDLDFGVQKCIYTIDARRYGNGSHFINHSCCPNLQVFAVWTDMQVEYMPRLAFFANRNIKRGEELTFDYKMRISSGNAEISFRCLCRSDDCRGSLV
ncbi:histone-lysine N-methyltransferase SUV39H2 [Caerostris darwini]|uniref:Histone-lysine N-methyltransferase n=1 Tax=Caerostris darwini TaxID=1538125 RepID=A0AAV4WTZ5_9ARAC|nr:histone-lysine N-methyltransferase SUV39H2 [Caerostris darwini]